jgi:chemotaxis protein MotB
MAGVLAAGLMFTGGCVGDQQYREALAANKRAVAMRQQAEQALNEMRGENAQLQNELAECNALVGQKQREVDLLERAKGELQAAYDRLAARLEESDRPLPPSANIEQVLPGELDTALKDLAGRYPDLVEYLPEYGMIKLKSDLTFAKGSDNVSADAVAALRRVADVMKGNIAGRFNVYVAGHTDKLPIKSAQTLARHPNNWYLSVHRAVAVQAVLTDAGLSPQRIAAMGFGEYHPAVAYGPNEKAKAANRRVELWVVPPDRFLTGARQAAEEDTDAPADNRQARPAGIVK